MSTAVIRNFKCGAVENFKSVPLETEFFVCWPQKQIKSYLLDFHYRVLRGIWHVKLKKSLGCSL